MKQTEYLHLAHWLLRTALAVSLLSGCQRANSASDSDSGHSHESESSQSIGLAIPGTVQKNLGITFAVAERRRVQQTLRVPGRFEYLPSAQREYRVPLDGKIELLVNQFDEVQKGQTLYRIDSLEWRDVQSSLADAQAETRRLELIIRNYEPLLEAHELHESSLSASITILQERVDQLEKVRDIGGGRVDELSRARTELANAESELASLEEKHVELQAQRDQASIDLDTATAQLSFLYGRAGSVLGIGRDEIQMFPWESIDQIEVHASRAGIVEDLLIADGTWAEKLTPVVRVTQPDKLRFHASVLQSDLFNIEDGQAATIIASGSAGSESNRNITGTLQVGLRADPASRTVHIYVTPHSTSKWIRDGVSAQLEIVTDESSRPVVAIPQSCVQQDGLSSIAFVRSPFEPSLAIRTELKLGQSDGQWVEVLDGIEAGAEVVQNGSFQLLLASSNSLQQGGHFHSDGTFHEGED